MRKVRWVALLGLAGLLRAQDGQSSARPGWPCVPGRAVDPAYLDISESTGGQLFLFQQGEVGQSAVVMDASRTHPATILRSVGHLNGTQDFAFPVDSTISSILVLVSLQCRNSIVVSRPAGSDLTAANSAFSVDLQAGRILRVDSPEPGPWRVRLSGTGLFVVSVLAKSELAITDITFTANDGARTRSPIAGARQRIQVRLSGQASNLELHIVDATGNRISGPSSLDSEITPRTERLRIRVTGTDAARWPFERMYPVLFRTEPRR